MKVFGDVTMVCTDSECLASCQSFRSKHIRRLTRLEAPVLFLWRRNFVEPELAALALFQLALALSTTFLAYFVFIVCLFLPPSSHSQSQPDLKAYLHFWFLALPNFQFQTPTILSHHFPSKCPHLLCRSLLLSSALPCYCTVILQRIKKSIFKFSQTFLNDSFNIVDCFERLK